MPVLLSCAQFPPNLLLVDFDFDFDYATAGGFISEPLSWLILPEPSCIPAATKATTLVGNCGLRAPLVRSGITVVNSSATVVLPATAEARGGCIQGTKHQHGAGQYCDYHLVFYLSALGISVYPCVQETYITAFEYRQWFVNIPLSCTIKTFGH